jgi:hypothetical protein
MDNIDSVKSACDTNFDNDIFKELAVANRPPQRNPKSIVS